jgi:hypothetical protein
MGVQGQIIIVDQCIEAAAEKYAIGRSKLLQGRIKAWQRGAPRMSRVAQFRGARSFHSGIPVILATAFERIGGTLSASLHSHAANRLVPVP